MTAPPPPSHERAVDTPVGRAVVDLWLPERPVGALVLGHGAGGRSWSADLLTLTQLAGEGWQVALVRQPWRVAGRRVAPAPAILDAAWSAVLRELVADGAPLARPLAVGGRSAGARVACRTAGALGADAVAALAFPLHPPGRPERSRAGELLAAARLGLPVLVVQGRDDPFGRPAEFDALVGGDVELAVADGGHAFRGRAPDVLATVRAWLTGRVLAAGPCASA